MKIVQTFAALIMVIGAPTWELEAFAQGYPSKPVRILVPFSTGGAVDIAARTIGQKLSEMWGQPVTVENHAGGGGGSVGAGVAAKSPADGYTLLAHSSGYALNAALYTNLPFDPLKDFVEIGPLGSQPNVLIVGTAAGVKSVAELIAAAKAKPGHMKYGSAGTGSATHLNAVKFILASGIDVAHIPYKGAREATRDTIAGRVTFSFCPPPIALSYIREGKVLGLGVSGARRSTLLPEVPTIAEAALPGFDSTAWIGIWVPAGTPADVVEKLAKDVAAALGAPDMREQFNKLGFDPMNMGRAEFTSFVRREIEDSARIIKAAGIKVQ